MPKPKSVYCRKCHEFEDDGQLYDQMMIYIAQLPQDICCEQEVYDKRLMVCQECQRLNNGMCAYCGCFVIVRAKKAKMTCPHPQGNKWLA